MNLSLSPLFEALLRASLQGAIALSAVWLICRFAPRLPAAVRAILWRLALLRLIIGLFFPAAFDLPILPASPIKPASLESPVPDFAVPHVALTETDASPNVITAPVTKEMVIADASPLPSFPEGIVLAASAYFLGVAFFAGRILVGFVRARRLYRASDPVDLDFPLYDTYREMAASLSVRSVPELRLSALGQGPLLLGGPFGAAVLLPATLAQELTTEEMRLLLAHELAHAKRRDLLFEWIGGVAQALFFFHPLLYVARAEEKAAREMACDEMALTATRGTTAAYGRLLMRVALPKASPSPVLSGAIGVAEQGNLLLRRLRALAAPRPPRCYLLMVASIIALPLAAALIPWRPVPAAAQPVSQSAPKTDTKEPATGATLTGRVLSPDGKPAVGAKVYALAETEGDPILVSAVTDNQGKWRLVCQENPDAMNGNRPDADTLIAADGNGNLTITPVQGFQPEYALRLIRPGKHTAVFRDAKNQPIPDLAVYAGTFHNNSIGFPPGLLKRLGLPTGEGKTDAQGRITVMGFPKTERVGFRTSDPRYAIYRTKYETIRGENRVSYTMFLSGTISGKVVPPPGTSPAGIPIGAAGNAALGSFFAGGQTVTDANGDYRIARLLPADYTLQFGRSKADYARRIKTHVVVKAGQDTPEVNVTLTLGAILQGKAHTEQGDPLPGVTISAVAGDARDAVVEYRKTDAQGQYQMRVPSGGIELEIYGALERTPTQRLVNVREGETHVEDFLIKGGRREIVSGVLLDAEGKPLTNAEITPGPLSGSPPDVFFLGSESTRGKGRFRFPHPLPVGEKIKLMVRQGEYTGQITTTTGENQTLRVPMKYLPLATVRGRVTNAHGKSLAAMIEAFRRLPNRASLSVERIEADSKGRFTFTARPEFPYRLTVSKEGEGRSFYPAGSKFLSFPAGKVTDLGDIKLPAANGILAGRVVDEKGNPITGTQIWLRGLHTWAIAPLAADGSFLAKNVVADEKLTATIIHQRGIWYFPGLPAGKTDVILTLKESKKTKRPEP